MRRSSLWCFLIGVCCLPCLSVAGQSAGQKAFDRGDRVSVEHFFAPLAAQGDPSAQAFVAYLRISSSGGLTGPEQRAIEQLTSLADAGNPDAMALLGQAYLEEPNEGLNRRPALHWLADAAAKGNPIAENDLGVLYAKGNGVPADPQVAIGLLTQSWEHGQASAATNLGRLYTLGFLGHVDYAQAMAWFSKSADLHDAPAEDALGDVYAFARGAAYDPDKAIDWYKRAEADRYPNDEQSRYNRALVALKGQNFSRAIAMFRFYLEAYPDGARTADALFWLAEAEYDNSSIDQALPHFQAVVSRFPNSAKVSAALYKVGLCQDALSQWERAKATFEAVIARYPASQESILSRKRLDAHEVERRMTMYMHGKPNEPIPAALNP